MRRQSYLIGYDISDDNLRAALRKLIRLFHSNAQKSVFECFLSRTERNELLKDVVDSLNQHADPTTDRFFMIRLYQPQKAVRLGAAPAAPNSDFIYIQ